MIFTIYSKAGCPYCDKIKQVMELAELNYTIYELDLDFSRKQFYAEFGEDATFPQVIMGDLRLGGCTDAIAYLKENKVI